MNVPLFTTSPTPSPTQPLHVPYTSPTAPTKTQAKHVIPHNTWRNRGGVGAATPRRARMLVNDRCTSIGFFPNASCAMMKSSSRGVKWGAMVLGTNTLHCGGMARHKSVCWEPKLL